MKRAFANARSGEQISSWVGHPWMLTIEGRLMILARAAHRWSLPSEVEHDGGVRSRVDRRAVGLDEDEVTPATCCRRASARVLRRSRSRAAASTRLTLWRLKPLGSGEGVAVVPSR